MGCVDAVGWDIKDYMAELPRTKVLLDKGSAKSLADKFPPLAFKDEAGYLPIVDGPAVFLDAGGAILAWSLPNLLLPWVEVSPLLICFGHQFMFVRSQLCQLRLVLWQRNPPS